MNEEKLNYEEIELEETKEIELPTIDVTKYVGQKVAIEKVTENRGVHGFFVKIVTLPVDVITGGKNDIEIKATRNFGLQEDKDGQVGWGKDTKLGAFLEKMKVNHYKKLVGKEVILQTITNTNDKRDYLTFN